MILGIRTGSLGDALLLTAPMKIHNDITVQMGKDQQSREVSAIYNGIANVEFVDRPIKELYHINNDLTHHAQRLLNQLKITEVNCIPKILVTKDEKDWAQEFLKDYKNPLVVINDNSGCHDKNNPRASYVRPPVVLMQQVANDYLKQGFELLQFGRKEDDRFTPLENTKKIRGLTIRQLAACYSVIGNILTGDTGDYHLMLSVGGSAVVLCPLESVPMGYLYHELHYKPALWKDEKVRVQYVGFAHG
jgi:hypothetical protein